MLHDCMINAETLMLPDTGHLPMLENPRTVAECWISYTERLARADGEDPAGKAPQYFSPDRFLKSFPRESIPRICFERETPSTTL